ncbi:hypothetical protein CBOM_01249 [Ceraceosorus bombacis]|uniref:Uncharacterized protein n=1 Tax=Ceraceosorus bombacis TaxID=401625 RepID=A0A0P1BBU6_9BASI|nr:hypothetical protein CBOM_01249 [Ceraceosorus bombacis]
MDFIVHKSTVSNDQISLEDRVQVLESEKKKNLMTKSQVKNLIQAALAQHKADHENLKKEVGTKSQELEEVGIKCQELEEKVEVLASENERLKLAVQWSKCLVFGLIFAAIAVAMVTIWHFTGDGLTEWARHPNEVPEWLVDYLKLRQTITIEPPLHWLDKAKLGVSNFVIHTFSLPPLDHLPTPPTPIKVTDVLGDLGAKFWHAVLSANKDWICGSTMPTSWKQKGSQIILVLSGNWKEEVSKTIALWLSKSWKEALSKTIASLLSGNWKEAGSAILTLWHHADEASAVAEVAEVAEAAKVSGWISAVALHVPMIFA